MGGLLKRLSMTVKDIIDKLSLLNQDAQTIYSDIDCELVKTSMGFKIKIEPIIELSEDNYVVKSR